VVSTPTVSLKVSVIAGSLYKYIYNLFPLSSGLKITFAPVYDMKVNV
jgi:hypothetical protein